MKTVIGLFNNLGDAKSTLGDFARLGLYADKVGLLSSEQGAYSNVGMDPLDLPEVGRAAANRPMLEWLKEPGGIAGALTRLGVSQTDAVRCIDTLKQGGTLEAVIVDDTKEGDATAIMRARTTHYERDTQLERDTQPEMRPEIEPSARAAATDAQTRGKEQSYEREAKSAKSSTEDIVIPIIEEELEIGKREVDAGGVRVATHVSDVPVEKTVTVREERIRVERRVVDRPVDDRDEVFQERAFEMKASAEQPYVTKRAHIVEEIRVHKDAEEHEEKIQDRVRHTEVDITDLPGGPKIEKPS